jgi:hypothetical protein
MSPAWTHAPAPADGDSHCHIANSEKRSSIAHVSASALEARTAHKDFPEVVTTRATPGVMQRNALRSEGR